MKLLKNLILFGLTAVLFTNCTASASRQVKVYSVAELPRLDIGYHVQEIKVLDNRKSTSSTEMSLPFISKPNQQIVHYPSLTPTHQRLIETTIQENASQSGSPINVLITIEDSYKEFTSTWSSEKERGFVQLQILLLDAGGKQQLAACGSSGEFFIQSLDATTQRMEEVYRVALRHTVYNCLKQIKQGQASN